MGRPRNLEATFTLGEWEKHQNRKQVVSTVELIRQWYDDIGIWQGWDAERFLRLAAFLNCTPLELGILAGLSGRQVERELKKNEFSVSASILLAIIEGWYMKEVLGKQDVPAVIPIDRVFGGARHAAKMLEREILEKQRTEDRASGIGEGPKPEVTLSAAILEGAI